MAAALAEAGYAVSIVSPIYGEGVYERDLLFLADPRWHGTPVKLVRRFQPWTYFRTALRLKLARRLLLRGALGRRSVVSLARGYTRAFDELLARAVAQPADLYLGGTGSGMAVAARAAELRGVPFALDLEDFHSAEQEPSPEANLSHGIIAELERRLLPRAAFLTGGSGPICQAYFDRYGLPVETIHNTFSLPPSPPSFALDPAGRLRIFWYSQVIGLKRGLEDAVHAVGLSGASADLCLLGHDTSGSMDSLKALASHYSPGLKLVHREPIAPEAIPTLAGQFDVGLALEQNSPVNRDLCLTNKAFTYMLAGLGVAFTDTTGQRPLAKDIGPDALLFKPGDIETFAAGLRRWVEQPESLLTARRAAWAAAVRRWHWEHPEERGKALALVQQALDAIKVSVA